MSTEAEKNAHPPKKNAHPPKINANFCHLVLPKCPTFNFDFEGFLIDIGMMGEVMKFLSEVKET